MLIVSVWLASRYHAWGTPTSSAEPHGINSSDEEAVHRVCVCVCVCVWARGKWHVVVFCCYFVFVSVL